MTKALKDKLEYRPKSQLVEPLPVTTNVSDRLDKLKDSSGNWKNRVSVKDAEKFTVAAKTSSQPAQLPFKRSEVRTCLPLVDFQSANPSPLGLAKSPSMVVSATTTTSNGSHKTMGLQLPAFSRSVSVPGQEESGENGGVKVVVPKLDEDKLFDKFFTSSSAATTPQDESNPETAEWDLDAITSTQRWVCLLLLLLYH